MTDIELGNSALSKFHAERGGPLGIRVNLPFDREIPNVSMIRATLNAALIDKFDLTTQFATEGGLQGEHNGFAIDLTNLDPWDNMYLGFVNETWEWEQGSEGLTEIMDFYEEMTRILLDEDFEKDGKKGGILLDASTEEDVNRVLSEMLNIAGGDGFSIKVQETIAGLSPRRRPYLAGLSDEDITRTFVQPPITIVRAEDLQN